MWVASRGFAGISCLKMLNNGTVLDSKQRLIITVTRKSRIINRKLIIVDFKYTTILYPKHTGYMVACMHIVDFTTLNPLSRKV